MSCIRAVGKPENVRLLIQNFLLKTLYVNKDCLLCVICDKIGQKVMLKLQECSLSIAYYKR